MMIFLYAFILAIGIGIGLVIAHFSSDAEIEHLQTENDELMSAIIAMGHEHRLENISEAA